MWRRTRDHLVSGSRWEQFNGRKVIAIARGRYCENPDRVQDEWPQDCEFIHVDNNPALQEVATHRHLMDRVIDEPGITLYCHTKGCTHACLQAPSHSWCDAMASACLDYPDLVSCAMEQYSVCGAFRVHAGWMFKDYHDWHFAGTWYWFNNRRALELDLLRAPPVFFGTEAWPGGFPFEESFCLFMDNTNSYVLYDRSFWEKRAWPSLRSWTAAMSKEGLVPLSSVQKTTVEV